MSSIVRNSPDAKYCRANGGMDTDFLQQRLNAIADQAQRQTLERINGFLPMAGVGANPDSPPVRGHMLLMLYARALMADAEAVGLTRQIPLPTPFYDAARANGTSRDNYFAQAIAYLIDVLVYLLQHLWLPMAKAEYAESVGDVVRTHERHPGVAMWEHYMTSKDFTLEQGMAAIGAAGVTFPFLPIPRSLERERRTFPKEGLLTLEEAMPFIPFSKSYLYKMVRKGAIPADLIRRTSKGGKILINARGLRDWCRQNPTLISQRNASAPKRKVRSPKWRG